MNFADAFGFLAKSITLFTTYCKGRRGWRINHFAALFISAALKSRRADVHGPQRPGAFEAAHAVLIQPTAQTGNSAPGTGISLCWGGRQRVRRVSGLQGLLSNHDHYYSPITLMMTRFGLCPSHQGELKRKRKEAGRRTVGERLRFTFYLCARLHPVTPALNRSNIFSRCEGEPWRLREEVNRMFDSLEDQMKAEDMEGSRKERWMRYIVISAISILAVAAVFGAVEFVK